MQIVKAKSGDVRDISVCRRESIQAMKEVYSREGLNVLLMNSFENGIKEELREEEVYCLMIDNRLIGTVSLDGSQISGLYVHPDFSGQGYGQKLLEFMEKRCLEKGMVDVYVYSMVNVKDFYLHNGYEISGIAYSLPVDNPVKFVIMRKKLFC
ncbi:MAG: GNAT family N-acetyltransferase [Nanoarchaeota archaeon]|jgi:GNAT superfamily N-acetyltransferase|nr:GNAT family N-acetyltransferase [Nanoarchaeota archaeon]